MRSTAFNRKIGLFYAWIILKFNRNSIPRRCAAAAGTAALFSIWGCTAYHPMPISERVVNAALKPPDMDQLIILASTIKHPVLHPLRLNPDEGLSPDSAAVLAVLLNPSLRAVRDQRALAKAQLLDAGLLPDPELTYSFDSPTGGGPKESVDAYGLGVDWNVTSLITRASKKGEAGALEESVVLDIAWQEWQVAQGAKEAVYQLLNLKDQIALLENLRHHTAENLANVRKAVSEGSMTAETLDNVRVLNFQVNEKMLMLKKQADQQRLKLMQIIGLPSDTQFHLSKEFFLPSMVRLPETSVLLNGLEQRRLDLLALRRAYESREDAVRAAVLKQFPDISIGPEIGRDTDNIRTIGFGITIELPLLNRNQGKIAIERATRKKLYDEYIDRVFNARSNISKLHSGILFLNEQITSAQATEAALRRLTENYRKALIEGRADALSYYSTWNDLIDVQTKVLDLKGQLSRAVVALELATGFYKIPEQTNGLKAAPSDTGRNQ